MVCAQDQPRGDAWVSTRPCGTPGLVNGRVGAAEAGSESSDGGSQHASRPTPEGNARDGNKYTFPLRG